MFRSASARQSDLAVHRLAAHQDYWKQSAGNWFDGTPDSIDNRIAKLDNILAFVKDTTVRLGGTEAGRRCVASIPNLERSRRELLAARDSLLNGFSDRQDASRSVGRRTAKPSGSYLRNLAREQHEDWLNHAGQHGYDPDDAAEKEAWLDRTDPYREAAMSSSRTAADLPYMPPGGGDGQGPPMETPGGGGGIGDSGNLPGPPPPSKIGSAPPSLIRAVVLGSRDFVADQNTDDREELLFRASRYAANETSTLPTPMARQISAAFVGAVGELINRRPRKRTAQKQQITAYEDFDDSLLF